VRETLRVAGATLGGINLMSATRWLAMSAPYPVERVAPDGSLPRAAVDDLVARLRIGSWTGLGCLYGSKAMVAAARGEVQRIIGPRAAGLTFMRASVEREGRRRSVLPWTATTVADVHAAKRASALELLSGVPNHTASPLAYWRAHAPRSGARRDPGRDGCGMLWYAPLIPMTPERVRVYVDLVRRVCGQYGVLPLMTMTSLSDRLFDGTVPLLFDRDSDQEAMQAEACYHALFREGKKEGFLPYRIGSQHMHLAVDPALPFWQLVSRLKRAVDPAGIMAPGRYAPAAHTDRVDESENAYGA
jgi:4-cresol dehydrogenase (hydroxylating)